MSVELPCALCGATGHDVKSGLAEWRRPIDGRRWDYVARCVDHHACRERVAASGEEWEVAEPLVRSARELIR